jgi:hypothetical protein
MENTALSGLGSIVISVCRVKLTGETTKGPHQPSISSAAPKDRKINEKAKKALLTHSVKYMHFLQILTARYGSIIEKPSKPTSWNYEKIDTDDSPIHVLEFLYRSRGHSFLLLRVSNR